MEWFGWGLLSLILSLWWATLYLSYQQRLYMLRNVISYAPLYQLVTAILPMLVKPLSLERYHSAMLLDLSPSAP